MATVACPLCLQPTEKILATELRRGTGTVMACEKCDLGFLAGGEPTDYHGAYRERASFKVDGGASARDLFLVYSQFQRERLALVEPFVKPDSEVLELGASAGQFIWQLQCARRCAIEPDADGGMFMQAMDIEVDNRPYRESVFSGQRFDVVCAFQVLEHVEEPVEFLREVRSAMKPGAVAFIEVPNLYDALRWSWAIPEYERFYFHGDHRWYFSDDSLSAVAHLAGFDRVDLRFTQDYSLLNHLHWLMNRSPQADCKVGLGPAVFTGEDRNIAAWLSDAMQKLDVMYRNYLVSEGITSNLTLLLRN